MYIAAKEGTELYWYGENIFISNWNGIFKTSAEETYLLYTLFKYPTVNNSIKQISQELSCDVETVQHFITTFLTNHHQSFELTDKPCRLEIYGEKGKYYPNSMLIYLTSSCKQNCKHCYKCASPAGHDINFSNLIHLLEQIENKVHYLYLSGGEPTLHPNFDILLEKFSSRFNICVCTSGYSLSQTAVQAILKSCVEVQVSIYGSTAEIHDSLTRTKGSLVSTMNFIRTIICSKRNPLTVSIVIGNHNIHDVTNTIELLYNEGVRTFNLGKIVNAGRGLSLKTISNTTFYALIDEVGRLYPDITILAGIHKRIPTSSEYPLGCDAGRSFVTVYEDGEIQPCGFIRSRAGNLGNICSTTGLFEQPFDLQPIIQEANEFYCHTRK